MMPCQSMPLHTNAAQHAHSKPALSFNFPGASWRTKDFKAHSLHQADYYTELLQCWFQSGAEWQGHSSLQSHFVIIYFQRGELEPLLQERKLACGWRALSPSFLMPFQSQGAAWMLHLLLSSCIVGRRIIIELKLCTSLGDLTFHKSACQLPGFHSAGEISFLLTLWKINFPFFSLPFDL